ncbi:extracellular solute-binding protein [Paenibacillus sp. MSJ-34]|uniref:ABC transporter substrate-binding protein n=1 Tax=Paenibacillus sp. MSJ-34 TaxID=2841529 RepID=UPI001C11D52B|nr:extracellular solute-binding protein [Paenibacillus sp. MSJ-34]
MIALKGMTWDHERGYDPLLRTTERFAAHYPDVTIHWDRRSLKDFGDYPVDALAQEYDLLMIDHPHVGICSANGVLVPLDDWIPADYLADQSEGSVGPSHRSYQWGGRQWALAVDAAAQVSSYRPDLLQGYKLPSTWTEVRKLADALPSGRKIGWPLCPTDAMCSFLSLCANIGGASFFDEAAGIPRTTGEAALAFLDGMLPLLHECSLASNPIQMYDRMSSTDEIAYVPLAFGYTNYARASCAGRRLRFADIPSMTGAPEQALLGGVGIAVSARSEHIPVAVRYAMFVASPEVQRTIYYEAGGQPGHAAAWTDERINGDCGDFFVATRRTMENSYMRPRHPAFPAYQEQAGVILHEALERSLAGRPLSESATLAELNRLYASFI